tara:strand:- start:465 stop:1700 length:1236 start_codon:yes stop_codon:yes gene_type:complete
MNTASPKLEDAVHELACEKIDQSENETFGSSPLLTRLTELGTELWIDTGDLHLARSIWKQELTSLTTNNTLANQVVQTGVMDDMIRKTASRLRNIVSDISEKDLVMEVGFVINCRIALRLVQAFHKKVSVELHPAVSRDIERTVYYGRRYFRVCPDYFNVKVPLTPEGYLAVRKLRKENIPINFTLGFSARQNYLAARLSNPDYVNVFLGRLNQVVSDNSCGSGKYVGEKVTWATQKVLWSLRKIENSISSHLIGASIRNGEQLVSLAGIDVLTVPPKAIREFLDSSDNNIVSGSEIDWKPEITSGFEKFQILWEVSRSFQEFVDDLVSSNDIDRFGSEDLLRVINKHGINLFYPFSENDLRKIYDQGKIPKLVNWPEKIALDDLMTTSALNSFAKDQRTLDNRIRSLLGF